MPRATAGSPRLRFEAPPAQPPCIEECAFYHSIELPGHPPARASWRIAAPHSYLGGVELAGRRVLDVGTASGLLAFTAERLGAREVVAFDLPLDTDYDARLPVSEAARAHHRARRALVRNGFWLCHRALGSRVLLAVGDVRRLPEDLGWFDVVILGNVLQHLRDPLEAVRSLAGHTDVLVVAEACWLPLAPEASPLTLTPFDAEHPFSWFQVRPELLATVLAACGFGQRTLSRHTQEFLRVSEYPADGAVREVEQGLEIPHYTVVARRA